MSYRFPAGARAWIERVSRVVVRHSSIVSVCVDEWLVTTSAGELVHTASTSTAAKAWAKAHGAAGVTEIEEVSHVT